MHIGEVTAVLLKDGRYLTARPKTLNYGIDIRDYSSIDILTPLGKAIKPDDLIPFGPPVERKRMARSDKGTETFLHGFCLNDQNRVLFCELPYWVFEDALAYAKEIGGTHFSLTGLSICTRKVDPGPVAGFFDYQLHQADAIVQVHVPKSRQLEFFTRN